MVEMISTPPAEEQESLLSTIGRVTSVMSLFTRCDIGPAPDIPPGPALYAANHRSLADLLLAAVTFDSWGRPIRPLVASAYFAKPGLGRLLRRLRCIPVEGAEALDMARAELEAGWSIALMPEGRVMPPEEWRKEGVGRARTGVGRLAAEAGVPVVAVGASGTEDFWPRSSVAPRFRPWRRYPLAIRTEVIGVIDIANPRDATEVVMEVVIRCVKAADAVAAEMRNVG